MVDSPNVMIFAEKTHDQIGRLEASLSNSRKKLYIASGVIFVTVLTGASPSKIENFGIEFTAPDFNKLLILVGLCAVYFLCKMILDALAYARASRMFTETIQVDAFPDELKDRLRFLVENNLGVYWATKLEKVRFAGYYILPALVGISAFVVSIFPSDVPFSSIEG